MQIAVLMLFPPWLRLYRSLGKPIFQFKVIR